MSEEPAENGRTVKNILEGQIGVHAKSVCNRPNSIWSERSFGVDIRHLSNVCMCNVSDGQS